MSYFKFDAFISHTQSLDKVGYKIGPVSVHL
jgi:hypothetical protein